jgi:hypothetical protein
MEKAVSRNERDERNVNQAVIKSTIHRIGDIIP